MNNFEKIPLSIQNQIFLKLFKQCEIAQYNSKEQMSYKQSVKDYNDWYAITSTAEQKGIVKGKIEMFSAILSLKKSLAEKKSMIEISRELNIPVEYIQQLIIEFNL